MPFSYEMFKSLTRVGRYHRLSAFDETSRVVLEMLHAQAIMRLLAIFNLNIEEKHKYNLILALRMFSESLDCIPTYQNYTTNCNAFKIV